MSLQLMVLHPCKTINLVFKPIILINLNATLSIEGIVIMKTYIFILLACVLTSCSTARTLNPSNNHIEISHNGKKSYCKKIPRIYSGIAYNVCLVYGEPGTLNNTITSINHVPFFIIDTTLSAVADTVVLPYTVYQQFQKGSIDVNLCSAAL